MIYPQNPPGTSKNQSKTLKNIDSPLGTMKNEPGTLKNHKNQPGTLKTDLEPWKLTWNHEKPGITEKRHWRGATTDLLDV